MSKEKKGSISGWDIFMVFFYIVCLPFIFIYYLLYFLIKSVK